jgi:tetratricopeptide (TPR) repeat protein
MIEGTTERARALWMRGDTAGAVALFQQEAEASVLDLGEEHPDTLAALGNLGVALYHHGDLSGARFLQERLLADRRRVSGREHPDTLKAMGNLAWTVYAQGELRKARALFQTTLRLRRRTSGLEHRETLGAMDNLAWVLQVMGDLRGARNLQEKVLKLRQKELGAEHPETVGTMGTLGATLYLQGHLARALELQEAALAANLKAAGPEDSFTLVAMGNLALTLRDSGDLVRARDLQAAVLETRHRLSKEDHPERLKSMTNLATTLHAMGDYAQAQKYRQEALAVQRVTLGVEHHDTLETMSNLAESFRADGDLVRATELAEEVLSLQQRTLGTEHPQTLITMASLSSMLLDHGEALAAKEMQNKVVDIRRRVSGESHTDTLCAQENLAKTMSALGESPEAQLIQEAVLKKFSDDLGEDNALAIGAKDALARILLDSGQQEAALALTERVFEQRKRVLGKNHPHTLGTASNYAARSWNLRHEPAVTAVRVSDLFSQLIDPDALVLSRVSAEVAADMAQVVKELLDAGESLPWRDWFPLLSRNWVTTYHLAPPGQVHGLREPFMHFHSIWLQLCVHHHPVAIPEALAALQGREMTAAVLEDLTHQTEVYDLGDLRREYLAVRSKVRALRVQLGILESSDDAQLIAGSSAEPTTMSRRQRHSMRRSVFKEHNSAFERLTQLEKEVANIDPDFARAMGHRPISAATLEALLVPGEALALLFALPSPDGVESPDSVEYFACCILNGSPAMTVPLPSFSTLVAACQGLESELRGSVAGRTMRGVTKFSRRTKGFARSFSVSEIGNLLERLFWSRLRNQFPSVSTWHLATHHNLHNVPFALGSETTGNASRVFVYPGVGFFGRAASQNPASATLNLHVDAAWHSAPIPFVEAEASLVKSLVHNATISRGKQTLICLQEKGGEPLAFSVGSHGYVTIRKSGLEESAILIDADSEEYMDSARWLSTGARPILAVLATCVGARLSEPFGGEPFGMVGALMMHGCRIVVGSLAVIPDFYMPLLTGLFWEAFGRRGNAHDAMSEAKRALRDGYWPEGFADKVRKAYAPIMKSVLERATLLDVALFRTIAGWHLPDHIRKMFFSYPYRLTTYFEFCGAFRGDLKAQEDLIAATLFRLIDERSSLPAKSIEQLCSWVHVFGKGFFQPSMAASTSQQYVEITQLPNSAFPLQKPP